MSLMGISFMHLGHAEILPALAVCLTIVGVCVTGYRQIKFKVAVLLILAAVFIPARDLIIYSLDKHHNQIHDGTIYTAEQWRLELLLVGSIMATISWGTGMVFLVRHFRMRLRK